MNDMGFVWFTKYCLRIQKVITTLYKEEPGRVAAMLSGLVFREVSLVDLVLVSEVGVVVMGITRQVWRPAD